MSKDVHVFSKIDVKEIARNFSTDRLSLGQDDAFYICDIGDVIEKYIRWKKVLPNAECFYAIKCNSDPLVLKTMAAIGMSFDCSSKYPRLLLRIIVNNNDAVYPLNDKFGADECMFNNLLNTAKELKLNVIGVSKILPVWFMDILICGRPKDVLPLSASSSQDNTRFAEALTLIKATIENNAAVLLIVPNFHCGGGNKSKSIYSTVISLTKKVFISGKEYGFAMNHIDFGGGFVAKTGQAVTLENASRLLQETIQKEFSGGEFAEIKLIGETGQYCVNSAFSLVTSVIGKKRVPVKDAEFDVKEFNDDKVEMFYYTNEGIFGSISKVFYGSDFIVSPLLLKENKGNKTSCTIWGHTMDGVDKICTEKEFPELFLGDKLLWLDMGAYTISASTNFNGFKTTDIIYIISDEMRKFLCENCSAEDLKAFNFI